MFRSTRSGCAEVPPNLVFVEIDKKTGLRATDHCLYPFPEMFFPGTEPSRFCTLADHMRVLEYCLDDKAGEDH